MGFNTDAAAGCVARSSGSRGPDAGEAGEGGSREASGPSREAEPPAAPQQAVAAGVKGADGDCPAVSGGLSPVGKAERDADSAEGGTRAANQAGEADKCADIANVQEAELERHAEEDGRRDIGASLQASCAEQDDGDSDAEWGDFVA